MRTAKRGVSARRLLAYAAATLAATIIVAVLSLVLFRNVLLNQFGKEKAERAFAQAHPGSVLKIGSLHYTFRPNRLAAETVLLHTTNATLEVEKVQLTGVRWPGLLLGNSRLEEALSGMRLDATNAHLQFAGKQYWLQAERVRASVPGREFLIAGAELRPALGEQAFFAASEFRRTLFRVTLPEGTVSGLDYPGMLSGTALRADSVVLGRPTLHASVNRHKPARPTTKPPLMVHEALAAISLPLEIGKLSISNADLVYQEQALENGSPGVLTFGNLNLSATGIANNAGPAHAIHVSGQGDLMKAGTLKINMSIPVDPPDFSLEYSGSLGPMDLTLLNDFIDPAERTRVKSGYAQEARFVIQVTDGQARGQVRAVYRDLEIAVLDEETRSEKGLINRISTFLANVFKIQNSKTRDESGATEAGVVDYARTADDNFLKFIWVALRTGVLDAISH